MNDDTLYSIGELARRTGLAVRTIRFYSDSGVVPPTNRNPAGYRFYDLDALVRLDLVRTLRDLGVDLATIKRVLEREITVPEVAATHAEALDVQIRALRLRRAVLQAVAKRGSSTEELRLMHQLADLSDEERRRLVTDFIDEAFGGLDANPEFVAMMRSAMPELPEDPAPAQLEAWVELAQLVRDPAFKAGVRRAAEHQAAERADGDQTGLHHDLTDLTIYVRERVESALADGIDPAGEEARPVLAELVARYAETFDKTDTPAYREKLVTRLEVASDPLTERYCLLLTAVNGTPVPPSLAPVFGWFLTALRQHPNP
jgi:DNA-binding transcriptional MerR regulator